MPDGTATATESSRATNPSRPVRLAFVGDVHGEFRLVARRLDEIVSELGPIDAVVCVGDVEPLLDENMVHEVTGPQRHRKLGDFPLVLSGRISFPTPVVFIGGNHDPWISLDTRGPGEWAPGFTYLGRAGIADVHGVRTAFLSGVYGEDVWTGKTERTTNLHSRSYFTVEEVELVAWSDPVDVLVMHEWPTCHEQVMSKWDVGGQPQQEIVETLRPPLTVVGHMHIAHRFEIAGCPIIALDRVHLERLYWLLVVEFRPGDSPTIVYPDQWPLAPPKRR